MNLIAHSTPITRNDGKLMTGTRLDGTVIEITGWAYDGDNMKDAKLVGYSKWSNRWYRLKSWGWCEGRKQANANA